MSIPHSAPASDAPSESQRALADVRTRMADAIHAAGRDGEAVELVAVSKTFGTLASAERSVRAVLFPVL